MELLKIEINQRVEEYVFDIINIIDYNVILEKFQFENHNLTLNFKVQIIELNKCACINISI